MDGGHNPQCVDALAAALESLYPGRKLIFLSGVLADKDWHSMFRRVLPLAKAFVAVTPDSPRALPAAELAAWLAQFSIPVSVQETLDQGVDTALALAGPEDVICVKCRRMGSGRRTKRQLSCGGAPLPLSYQGILLRQLKRKPLRGSLSP